MLQRKMNEKIKKVFASIGVFFTGVFTSLLCVFGISLYNDRNGTKTTGKKQSDYKEPIRNIEDRIKSNESIFAEIRKRKKDN